MNVMKAHKPLALFNEQSILDSLADLIALMNHLADCEHHDHGLILLHRIIRDSLIGVAEKLINERFPQAE